MNTDYTKMKGNKMSKEKTYNFLGYRIAIHRSPRTGLHITIRKTHRIWAIFSNRHAGVDHVYTELLKLKKEHPEYFLPGGRLTLNRVARNPQRLNILGLCE